jgi:hypothetical protein
LRLPASLEGEIDIYADRVLSWLLTDPYITGKMTRRDAAMAKVFARAFALAGFKCAVSRYIFALKDIPELSEWRRAQKSGGDKGRKTLTERKEQKAQRIRDKWAAMERAGEKCTYQAVADALKAEGEKCSRSTVDRAINQRAIKRKTR